MKKGTKTQFDVVENEIIMNLKVFINQKRRLTDKLIINTVKKYTYTLIRLENKFLLKEEDFKRLAALYNNIEKNFFYIKFLREKAHKRNKINKY